MEVDVLTLEGKVSGSVTLDDTIYGLEPRADVLHRVVIWQLARRRQGTHKSKGRSEITGSTKKIIRQKGSGGARHGDKKVPQYRGGGKAHGPVVRSHETDLPKKVRRLGLKLALSSKARAEGLIVLDEAKLDAPKTKALKEKLDGLKLKSALVIDGSGFDRNFELAARNIPLIDVLPVQGLNARDILRRDVLVLTRSAVDQIEARLK